MQAKIPHEYSPGFLTIQSLLDKIIINKATPVVDKPEDMNDEDFKKKFSARFLNSYLLKKPVVILTIYS